MTGVGYVRGVLRGEVAGPDRMRFELVGEGETDLLLLLGWGNRRRHDTVDWLVGRLVEAGYRVHVGEIPTNGTDFRRDYLAPAREHLDGHGVDRVLSHSTGGLVTAHLELDVPRVYLSPWWGMPAGYGVARALVRLPTARPVVPVPDDPDALGDLATDRQVRDGPNGISPAFLRMIADAQARLPPLREGATVFCSLRDRIVGLAAIGERTPPERIRLYDGGHEFFSSSGREAVLEDVLADLEAGPPAR